MNIRPSAVAGRFYPAAREPLEAALEQLFASADTSAALFSTQPKAIISPHAGIVYSGPIAAAAYRHVEAFANTVERVVLVGPSHYLPLRGVATCSADAYGSPLGNMMTDRLLQRQLERELEFVQVNDAAHAPEHSLELQLPFLQTRLPRAKILPLVVGATRTDDLIRMFEQIDNGKETLWVLSSDLSHFLSYDEAVAKDTHTSAAIEGLAWEQIQPDDACGYFPLRGLLAHARNQELHCHRCELKNSGDTHGPKDRVVGYGSYWISTRPTDHA